MRQCDQELLVLDLHLSQLLPQPLQGLSKIRGWLFCCFHLSALGRDLDAGLMMGLTDFDLYSLLPASGWKRSLAKSFPSPLASEATLVATESSQEPTIFRLNFSLNLAWALGTSLD